MRLVYVARIEMLCPQGNGPFMPSALIRRRLFLSSISQPPSGNLTNSCAR
jgi:hypothetical protein